MNELSLKVRVFKIVWRMFLILLGSAISASGIVFLLEPHKLLTGGVTGTAMLISYLTPFGPGIWIIVMNIPLFILAWRKIDLQFCVYSIIGTAALSGMLMIFNTFQFAPVADPILASLFGGMLCGGGTGLVMRARGSHGGTDIISVIVRKKIYISLGTVGFYLNLVIVSILALKFSLELALLTIFAQYISAISLDRVVTGLDTTKAVTIVSDRADEMADYIMKKLYRGVTFLDGEGGYGRTPKKVIWCIITTSQLIRVKSALKKIDPNAFMVINDASEIVGKGFYSTPF